MNPLFLLRELFSRCIERKWAIISLFLLCLCSIMCGIVFIKTPTFFDYYLKACDRFLDSVCYSDRSVVLICLERTAGSTFFLLLVLIGGIHPAALVLPTSALAFRAYTFGGTTAILFSVYKVSGALVFFTLYLPIQLLLGIVFLAAASLSFSRAFRFCFQCDDFRVLFVDFVIFFVLILLVCIFEALLLGVLYHPLGIF